MTVREAGTSPPASGKLPFSGYHTREIPAPDPYLTQVGPGTPMGEYMRRFWQPVCLSDELTDLPKSIRILGEDLVVFRDKSESVGVLHRHCSHRGTSLEYGIVSEQGIRCCYHGWLFDVDGTVLETPGEPPESKLKDSVVHGAYPAQEYKGIVHAYMGPPDLRPHFPKYDFFGVPGAKFAPFSFSYENNWLQSHENAVDPVHSVFLHGRITEHFIEPFSVLPHLTWEFTDGAADCFTRPSAEWTRKRSGFVSCIPSCPAASLSRRPGGSAMRRCTTRGRSTSGTSFPSTMRTSPISVGEFTVTNSPEVIPKKTVQA